MTVPEKAMSLASATLFVVFVIYADKDIKYSMASAILINALFAFCYSYKYKSINMEKNLLKKRHFDYYYDLYEKFGLSEYIVGGAFASIFLLMSTIEISKISNSIEYITIILYWVSFVAAIFVILISRIVRINS